MRTNYLPAILRKSHQCLSIDLRIKTKFLNGGHNVFHYLFFYSLLIPISSFITILQSYRPHLTSQHIPSILLKEYSQSSYQECKGEPNENQLINFIYPIIGNIILKQMDSINAKSKKRMLLLYATLQVLSNAIRQEK